MSTENNRAKRAAAYRKEQQRNPSQQKTKAVEMLPDPEVLESYGYVVEGAPEQILRMFESEQKHRHNWEMQALKAYTISSIFGQVLGFIIAIAVFGSAAIIGLRGDSSIAAFIWVFGMSIIMMSGLVWTYAKTMGQRPLFGRPTFRRHFRAEAEEADKS